MSIKELRERTQAGLLDCKKALEETGGDIEKAIEVLREKGLAKANKRAGMDACDGAIVALCEGKKAAIMFLGSETDFVAKSDTFGEFANHELKNFMNASESDIHDTKINGEDLTQRLAHLTAKVGEKTVVNAACKIEATGAEQASLYLHNKLNEKFTNIATAGVIFITTGANDEQIKQIGMHIVSFRPVVMKADDLTAEHNQMIENGAKKKELVLELQAFLMDPSKTFGDFCKENGITFKAYHSLHVK